MTPKLELSVTPDAPVLVEPVTVPVAKLKLDPDNVRFKHLRAPPSDSEIEKILWNEPDTQLLYEEIRASGGLSEKPLVDPANVVKEGNRRVVCLRRLSARAHKGEFPSYKVDHFDYVQVLMLPPNTSAKSIDIFLARVHVKGKKPWVAFNKAQHIHNLSKTHKMSYTEIAQFLGMSKSSVQVLIKAYESTEDYGSEFSAKDPEWYRKFTYFHELLKRRDLADWRAKPGNGDKFKQWVLLNKFKDDVRKVRKLAAVLSVPEAIKLMDNPGSSIEDALAVVSKKDPTVTSEVYRAVKQTTEMLRNIPRAEFVASIKDTARVKLLVELKNEVQEIIDDIQTLKANAEKTT